MESEIALAFIPIVMVARGQPSLMRPELVRKICAQHKKLQHYGQTKRSNYIMFNNVYSRENAQRYLHLMKEETMHPRPSL